MLETCGKIWKEYVFDPQFCLFLIKLINDSGGDNKRYIVGSSQVLCCLNMVTFVKPLLTQHPSANQGVLLIHINLNLYRYLEFYSYPEM